MTFSPKIIVATVALVLIASVMTLLAIHRTPSEKTSDWNSLLNDTVSSSSSPQSVPASSASTTPSAKPSDPSLPSPRTQSSPQTPTERMVDIKGAVLNPGVYKVKEGDRVIDAIELAGGVSKNADSSVVNLSQHVTDEMVIYVPKKGESMPPITQMPGSNANSGSSDTSSTNKVVHLNSSSLEDLQTLPGVGPTKAQAILSYRETNGPFKSLNDLVNVTGIGDKTVERLSPYLDLN